MRIGFVFPGQGSQEIGMLADTAQRWPVVKQTFQEASEVLGYDLWKLSQEGPAEELNRTTVTQPALLTASVALWRCWEQEGGARPECLAGHSLGEYSALVVAQSLTFVDAVGLVQTRAQAMQSAVPEGEGLMAAIIGLEDAAVAEICREQAGHEVVEAVNFNSPGQVVIAGNRSAVERTIEACRDAGARRAMALDVSVPSHCSLMQPAAQKLEAALAEASVQSASIPVIQNATAEATTDATRIRENLAQQLVSPVRWTESVRDAMAPRIDALVECGPGKVLTGLVKRIDRQLPCFPTATPELVDRALSETQQ